MQATMMTARIAHAVLVPDGRRERDSRNLFYGNSRETRRISARRRFLRAKILDFASFSRRFRVVRFS
jgi:hypothetical protein